ncbi:MAG: DUF5753 domain-containing protein [Actinoplanes sp.]
MSDSLGSINPGYPLRWWARHHLSDECRQYTDYEAEADRITVYQPLVVPGLLQTPAYAAAASRVILTGYSEADIEARVQARIRRQQVIEQRIAAGAAPELVVILDEIVLRRAIGDAAIIRDQLEHLVAQAQRPHVTLTVLPTALGGHPGLGGVFELLEFHDDRDPALAFIESASGDRLTRDTLYYRQTADALTSAGTTGDEAVALVRRVLDE